MFNRATCCQSPPTYLSADHDPLYRFHPWQANLRILNIREIKTVPRAAFPSGRRTADWDVRREYLIVYCSGAVVIWAEAHRVPGATTHRTHAGRAGRPPAPSLDTTGASLWAYRWRSHCRGLYTRRWPRDAVDPQRVHRSDLRIRHSHVRTTMTYLHVMNRGTLGVKSPMDRL